MKFVSRQISSTVKLHWEKRWHMRHREPRMHGEWFRSEHGTNTHGYRPGHMAPFGHRHFGQAQGPSEAQHVMTLDD